MPLVYRTDGAWGTGKGANLTPAEADENFHGLDGRVTVLEDNPPTARGIAGFSVEGSQLKILLDDSSEFGPYTLPVAAWSARGEWQPETIYRPLDVLTVGGSAYLVMFGHESAETFDASATGDDGNLYSLLISVPGLGTETASYYNPGILGADITAPDPVFVYRAAEPLWIGVDFLGAVFGFDVPPVLEMSIYIRKNDDRIGSIHYDPELPGGFETLMFDIFAFAVGDRLIIESPGPMLSGETGGKGFGITFKLSREELF